MPDKIYLRQMQGLPLIVKVRKTQLRIKEWYEHFDGNVCVSFSGGKDSTVLAHLVRELYPEIPLVFADTGLEYPEVRQFARKMGAEIIRPKMRFDEVISKYGYPIISKEVAQAVYYARKIYHVWGGVSTTNAMNSRVCGRLRGGGYTSQARAELNGLRLKVMQTSDGENSPG
jgi:PP-loop superfamily ATP-utilizing enzyme